MYANYSMPSVLTETKNKVLSQSFMVVTVMMAIMGAVAFMTKSLSLPLWVHLTVIVASFILLFVIEKYKTSGVGLGLLMLFAVLDGVSSGHLLNHYLKMQNGPMVVTLATMTTAAITFACSMYAIVSKKDFSFMGGFLLVGTIGLLIAMIINIFLALSVMTLVIACIGVLLFSAWLLYDVSNIVNGGETNYISASVGIFLSIKNILNFVLQIFGISIGNND